ncbi:hypothetical protein pb186bvf_002698 [Paramecium bursaria]
MSSLSRFEGNDSIRKKEFKQWLGQGDMNYKVLHLPQYKDQFLIYYVQYSSKQNQYYIKMRLIFQQINESKNFILSKIMQYNYLLLKQNILNEI